MAAPLPPSAVPAWLPPCRRRRCRHGCPLPPSAVAACLLPARAPAAAAPAPARAPAADASPPASFAVARPPACSPPTPARLLAADASPPARLLPSPISGHGTTTFHRFGGTAWFRILAEYSIPGNGSIPLVLLTEHTDGSQVQNGSIPFYSVTPTEHTLDELGAPLSDICSSDGVLIPYNTWTQLYISLLCLVHTKAYLAREYIIHCLGVER
jgi:hypothetical protein